MAENRVYTVAIDAGSVINGSHSGTLVQILNASTQVVELIRAWFDQTSITTSQQQAIKIVRKSAAATVSSATPAKTNVGDPASSVTSSTSGTGTLATAEGTDSTVVVSDAFSMLNGWLWVPTPTDRITVPPSGIIALKLGTVPAGTTVVNCGLEFKEIG